MINTLSSQHVFRDPNFPLVVQRHILTHVTSSLHAHEFTELVLIIGGTGIHETGGKKFALSAGDAFVISGNRPHQYQDCKSLSLFNILFRDSMLDIPRSDLGDISGFHSLFNLEPVWRTDAAFESHYRLEPKTLPQIIALVENIELELEERQPGWRAMATAGLIRLISSLSRTYERTADSVPAAMLRLEETISYMENRYTEPLDIGKLAKRACMSEGHFIRTFKRAFGLSPIEFLIRHRILKACVLLTDTDQPITTIAFDTGFNDGNYFSRQFRKTSGISPSEFRRRNSKPRIVASERKNVEHH